MNLPSAPTPDNTEIRDQKGNARSKFEGRLCAGNLIRLYAQEGTPSVTLPCALLERLVEKTSHREFNGYRVADNGGRDRTAGLVGTTASNKCLPTFQFGRARERVHVIAVAPSGRTSSMAPLAASQK